MKSFRWNWTGRKQVKWNELTVDEAKGLLVLLRMGKWVLGDDRKKSPELHQVYHDVLSSIQKKHPGLLLDVAKTDEKVSQDLEERAYELLEEYEEYIFWEDLPHRLAGRDLEQENQVGDETRFEQLVEIYKNEFAVDGIQRLVLKKD